MVHARLYADALREMSAVWLVADADALWRAARCGGWLSRRAFSLGLEGQGTNCLARVGGPSCRRELGIWG